MGLKITKVDFDWTVIEEPHRTRRRDILKVHPEIKKLMTHDPSLKFKIVALVLCQVVSAAIVSDRSWWLIFASAYLWGGLWNHSLALAIHEVSHNLAFGPNRPIPNRILGIIANLPIGVPFSVAFRKYHMDHHRYQGVDRLDVDIPTALEARIFKTKLMKLVWILLQPLFYAGRPLLVNPKPLEKMEVFNTLAQITFNCLVYHTLSLKALVYLISGTFLAMGLHPMSGHFISEHFVFEPGQETYSYYGPLNALTFNVGYHNEHHDFPNIPGKFLPSVKKMAPEFYDNLRHYQSWTGVLWRFLMDDTICLKSRVRRTKVL